MNICEKMRSSPSAPPSPPSSHLRICFYSKYSLALWSLKGWNSQEEIWRRGGCSHIYFDSVPSLTACLLTLCSTHPLLEVSVNILAYSGVLERKRQVQELADIGVKMRTFHLALIYFLLWMSHVFISSFLHVMTSCPYYIYLCTCLTPKEHTEFL